MTNTEFHGMEAKRARRRARILKRRGKFAAPVRRSGAAETTVSRLANLIPPPNPEGFSVTALPAPEKAPQGAQTANVDQRPELSPAAMETPSEAPGEGSAEVSIAAPEFGCLFCDRTFPTKRALAAHKGRAHKGSAAIA